MGCLEQYRCFFILSFFQEMEMVMQLQAYPYLNLTNTGVCFATPLVLVLIAPGGHNPIAASVEIMKTNRQF